MILKLIFLKKIQEMKKEKKRKEEIRPKIKLRIFRDREMKRE